MVSIREFFLRSGSVEYSDQGIILQIHQTFVCVDVLFVRPYPCCLVVRGRVVVYCFLSV